LSTLRSELGESLAEGERLAKLTERVNEIFDGLEKDHAQMIARTEAARSYVAGGVNAARNSGVVGSMRWMLSPDPCPECQEYEGAEIDIEEDSFGTRESGGDHYSNIEHPPLHPNCFCDLEFVIDESGNEDNQEEE
jgi:hypothetical protein